VARFFATRESQAKKPSFFIHPKCIKQTSKMADNTRSKRAKNANHSFNHNITNESIARTRALMKQAEDLVARDNDNNNNNNNNTNSVSNAVDGGGARLWNRPSTAARRLEWTPSPEPGTTAAAVAHSPDTSESDESEGESELVSVRFCPLVVKKESVQEKQKRRPDVKWHADGTYEPNGQSPVVDYSSPAKIAPAPVAPPKRDELLKARMEARNAATGTRENPIVLD
jgi:hypothetical protein